MMSPSRASGSPGQETFAVGANAPCLPRSNGLPPPLGERWLDQLEGEQWAGINGYFSRVPIGQFKVGSIAADRTGLLLTDPRSEQWARPEWVRQESIACFAGQPLVFRDETLGVLAVFRREPINQRELGWLQMFANEAAAAVANARAFSELDRLRQQLESHNAY